jgi:molybdopterin/thiamine biosynthesis adenylyltransferase/rhodanese-related sulfurtransferase
LNESRILKMALDKREKERYSRQILMPGFGVEAQQQLKDSRVLVIGAGGLGCPVLQYLAAAGVGSIGVVDNDTVSFSNLHRQILYAEHDIGALKAEKAVEKLGRINSAVELLAYPYAINKDNAADLVQGYDILVDCTDNFASRYLINDIAVLHGLAVVYGSVHQFEGQVSVFNYLSSTGRSPNYRDLFPVPPDSGSVLDCSEGGVLGVLPAIIGSLQANEVIKIITGQGEPLASSLLLFDALNNDYKVIKFKNSEPPILIEELIDYDLFCNSPAMDDLDFERSPKEVKTLIDTGAYVLVDIREPEERALTNIGGIHVQRATILDYLQMTPDLRKVIFYCRSGKRSRDLIQQVQNSFEGDFFSLKGGLLAYIDYWDLGDSSY